jgi:RNA polymerase sigma factor (sigma-70 family)
LYCRAGGRLGGLGTPDDPKGGDFAMAGKALNKLLHGLRELAGEHEEAALTDGALLAAYVASRDQSAFADIVRRHGPMVLGVCRRILRNDADSEDAFQATFLVLVRKAGAIRQRQLLGNWLYGVAHNTALKAKAMIRKRQQKESEAGATARAQSAGAVWQRLQELLDAEMSVLSDKYRAAIVLCDLEGKSIKEAARQLGWPQGTLATRLARGRALLARRLAGHGLALSAGALATLLCDSAASASVPPLLAAGTVSAASGYYAGAVSGLVPGHVVALAENVLSSMPHARRRLIAALLVMTSMLACAGGLFAYFNGETDPVPPRSAGVSIRPRDVALGSDTAPPDLVKPSLSPLRPGWKVGESYFYSIQMEAKLKTGAATFTRVGRFGAGSHDAASRLQDRSDLLAEAANQDGTSNCLAMQYDYPTGVKPEGPVDSLSSVGDGYLSFAAGLLAMLTTWPATGDQPTWENKSDCVWRESVPVDPRRKFPRKTTLYPAEETSFYALAKQPGDWIVIHKTYSLQTQKQMDGKPFLRFEGTGKIMFDVKLGLTRTMEFSGVLSQAGVEDVPVSVSYRLLEGEERTKAMKDREEWLKTNAQQK